MGPIPWYGGSALWPCPPAEYSSPCSRFGLIVSGCWSEIAASVRKVERGPRGHDGRRRHRILYHWRQIRLCPGDPCMARPVLSLAPNPAAAQYDLVLQGGRVMDPETGLDAVMIVGIRDGRIAAILAEAMRLRPTAPSQPTQSSSIGSEPVGRRAASPIHFDPSA